MWFVRACCAQELERQLAEWKNKCETIEKRESERRAQDDKKHAEEARRQSFSAKTRSAPVGVPVWDHRLGGSLPLAQDSLTPSRSVCRSLSSKVAFLTRQNKQLKAQLEAFLAPAKK